MDIFLKIPAWHSRPDPEERLIEQPWITELPKLNEGDRFKVNGKLWRWSHIEYDCDSVSAIIVLHIYPDETKEEEQKEVYYPDEDVLLLSGDIITIRTK